MPELLTSELPRVRVNPSLLSGDSPSIDSVLDMNSVRLQDAGVYWCQVSINGSSEGLRPSQQLLLRMPEEYSMFPVCSRHVYITETLCADDGMHINDTAENLTQFNAVNVGNTTTESSTQLAVLAEVGKPAY